MIELDPLAHPWAWHGGAVWERDSARFAPWRIPPADLRSFDAEELVLKARMAAGVRLEVDTDAASIEMTVEALDEGTSPLDLVVDGELALRSPIGEGATTVRLELPDGRHRVELWLPHFGRVLVSGATLAGVSDIEPVDQRPTWFAYGSSITHSRSADGPSTTWPALVDRALGWDHSSLGLGGQCHLDPPARRTMTASDADLFVACLGINMYQAATFGPRGLEPQLGGFLADILAARPTAPLVVVSPIPSPSREDEPNAHGLTLADVRESVESVARSLAADHENVSWISGPELLRFEEADGLLPDGLHPGQAGMRLIAERLAPRLLSARG